MIKSITCYTECLPEGLRQVLCHPANCHLTVNEGVTLSCYASGQYGHPKCGEYSIRVKLGFAVFESRIRILVLFFRSVQINTEEACLLQEQQIHSSSFSAVTRASVNGGTR